MIRRQRFHATWVVEFEDGPQGITPMLPVAPSRMQRVISMIAARLLDDAHGTRDHGVRVGAVTVASMPEDQWPRLPLAMIPLPSGDTGHGGGPDW